ncbi:MAG: hypothetical protein IKE55_09385 [Kiritimatiellae bacterium]|nr:hypothetical protein [Kiritimatiellia bacterium]
MRTFGKDSPRFMEFMVDGDERVYRLPLAASIRADFNLRLFEVARVDDPGDREYFAQKLMIDIFTEYLGEEFVASMTTAQMLEIWLAWTEESRRANQEPGE